MKRLNIIRALNLNGAIPAKARQAWKELWRLPPPGVVNLRTAAELMTEEELENNFELWHRVVVQDLDDARRRLVDKTHRARSSRGQRLAHTLELYVLMRELLTRYAGGRLTDVGDDVGGPPAAGDGVET